MADDPDEMTSLRERYLAALDGKVKREGLEQRPGPQEVAEAVGTSRQNIHNIEIGQTKALRGAYQFRLAEYLGVTHPSLALGPRLVYLRAAFAEYQKGKHGPARLWVQSRPVRIIGTVSQASTGKWTKVQPVGDLDETGDVMVPTDDAAAYALRVVGDSLRPRYRDGEVLIFSPGVKPQPDDDVLVTMKSGEQSLRIFGAEHDGRVTLYSVTDSGGPITVGVDELASIHCMIGHRRQAR